MIDLAPEQLSDKQLEGLQMLAEHTMQEFDPTRPVDVQYACDIAENARRYFYGDKPNPLIEKSLYEQVNPIKTFYNNAAALASDLNRYDLVGYYQTKAENLDIIPGGYVSEYDLNLLDRLIRRNIDPDFTMPKSEQPGSVFLLPRALKRDE